MKNKQNFSINYDIIKNIYLKINKLNKIIKKEQTMWVGKGKIGIFAT